ncbi:MAG: hypothetical protein E7625_05385 [Ruminococcaceae bacterium]|nr:hypothetical protein [Oscillospiraceae bacterium]
MTAYYNKITEQLVGGRYERITRRPLAKEGYKTALTRQIKHELLIYTLSSLPYSLIFCLLALCLYFLLSPFSPTWAIITLVFFLLPPVAIYCHEIGRAIYRAALVKQDKLIIIQDTMINTASEDCIRHPLEGLRRGRILTGLWSGHIDILHFSQNKKYIPGLPGQYDASFCGDTFYVVMYNGIKQRPALIYNTKNYELKE